MSSRVAPTTAAGNDQPKLVLPKAEGSSNTRTADNDKSIESANQSSPEQGTSDAETNKSCCQFSEHTHHILPSLVACMVAQAVAAFYYGVTKSTIDKALQNAFEFSGDDEKDGDTIYIVFSCFTILASAWCVPMIQKFDYKMVVLCGGALLLYSSVGSSLVTSPYVLILPYAVLGACGYAFLKTGPQVAMLDYLHERRQLAITLSQLSVSAGLLTGGFAYGLSDMTDDATYAGDGTPRWPNNFRVIDVTAVISMGASSLLLPPSFKTGSWSDLLKSFPFYTVCVLGLFYGLGFDLVETVYSDIPNDRDFDANPPGATILTASFVGQMVQVAISLAFVFMTAGYCKGIASWLFKHALFISVICSVALSILSYVNKGVYENYGTFVVFAAVGGFSRAVVSICLPLALMNYTTAAQFKIGICFLEAAIAVGTLESFIIQAEGGTSAESRWYIAAGAFTVYSIAGILGHFVFAISGEDTEPKDPAEVSVPAANDAITDLMPDGVVGAEALYDGSLN